MRREIKFRAWNGVQMFRNPFYVNAFDGSVWGDSDPNGVEMSGKIKIYYPTKQPILMQFTGLRDKNGVEIYEGDLLREPSKSDWDNQNYSCFEVFFHDGDAHVDYNIGYSMSRMHNHGSICGGYVPSFKPKTVSKMEVIGNIHQNPELLDQTK